MKIIKIDERFSSPRSKEYHYSKHVKDNGFSDDADKRTNHREYEFTTYEYPTSDDYERGADEFARSDIRDKNIECFVDKDGKFHKYNKATDEFTVYSIENGEPINISYYLFTPDNGNRWQREKNKYYYRDATYEEDSIIYNKEVL